MYIYKDCELPQLKGENRDIIKRMKNSKIKYALWTLVLLAFDIFVYCIYFLRTKNSFHWHTHILFWCIFFALPYILCGLYRLFTDKSYTAEITHLRQRQVYWIDRFDVHNKRTRQVVDYRFKLKNGYKKSYRTFNEEGHHLVLKQGNYVIKLSGLKYAIAVNSSLPKYFICAKCGYLCDVEDTHCGRCSTSVIKIFTEEAYCDAETEIQNKIQERASRR